MTEPEAEPFTYPPELLAQLRDALAVVGFIDHRSRPADDQWTPDGQLVELLDELRENGWIVQPAPVAAPMPAPLPDAPAPSGDQ